MDKLRDYAKEYNIEISEAQLEQFNVFYEMLIEKNKVMNLTAITEKNEVIVKHFIDSIVIANYFDFKDNMKLIDVGTGAGFPGIPLKIIFPNIKVTLFDSLNKRINFLNEVIDKIRLTDIDTIHSRAEDGGRDKNLRQKYDVVVSRAVANMSVLCEYCLPFVSKGGVFISYKSGHSSEEIENSKKAIKILGGKIEKVIDVNLLDTDISRTFVIIRKVKDTPKLFPRKAGIVSKEPL